MLRGFLAQRPRRLGFILVNDESRAFVKLVERDYLWADGIAPEQFERTIALLVHTVVTYELVKAADNKKGLRHVVKSLFTSWISNIIRDRELGFYRFGGECNGTLDLRDRARELG